MDLMQTVGRYFRLKRELAAALKEKPPNRAQVERLIADLSVSRSEIFKMRQVDEQSGDSLPFLTSAFMFSSSQFDDGPDSQGVA